MAPHQSWAAGKGDMAAGHITDFKTLFYCILKSKFILEKKLL